MPPKKKSARYSLVTAARDEEAHIERVIRSVVSQTALPQAWIIVSDGSRDRTDVIAQRYAAEHDFIQFLRREPDSSRDFGSKVYAIRAGVERLGGMQTDFIGILDADVTFEPWYYEKVLRLFEENSKLGIAGGMLSDFCAGKWIPQHISTAWSVSGPIQMFRWRCYEDIGGYLPLERGGEDATAEVMARMHGWEVRSFPDIEVLHYRPTGACSGSALVRQFQFGIKEYTNGTHPLFQVAKCCSRCFTAKPYVLGAGSRLSGYFWALVSREQQVIPKDIIRFLRREQMQRLWHAISSREN